MLCVCVCDFSAHTQLSYLRHASLCSVFVCAWSTQRLTVGTLPVLPLHSYTPCAVCHSLQLSLAVCEPALTAQRAAVRWWW